MSKIPRRKAKAEFCILCQKMGFSSKYLLSEVRLKMEKRQITAETKISEYCPAYLSTATACFLFDES